MPNPYYSKEQIKSMVELTRPDLFYQVTNEYGDLLDFSSASGRDLLNHLRHRVTNYDDVLEAIERQQGSISGRQVKHATNAATELVLALYRDEHVRVIQVAQDRGNVIRNLMQRVGVSSATALSNLLDTWSERLKTVAKLENSQRKLQQWNDTYRVQRTLVKKILEQEGVEPSIRTKVDQIYSTRSVNKAISMGESLLDWEQSEILKLVKKAIRYKNLSSSEDEEA